MNKKNKKLALIFTSILCGTAAVVVPTSLVINNKLNNKFEYLLLDNISNQMDSISDSSSINNYIGSYDPNGSNTGLNQIVNDIKDNFGSDIKINSVTTSYSAPIDGKVAINLDLKYTYSTVSNDQQTINKQIKTNIDAIEFNDASFIKQIQSLDNENFDELNNLQQSIVGMNVGVDPGDLSSVNITTNPINTPAALSAEVSDNGFVPYTLSFAFTSSNSALFYNPSESSKTYRSAASQTPNYSKEYNVQNVNVLQEKNQTINLETISNNFMNLSGIYSLFNESTSLFDSDKIINLLCKDNPGLDRNIIDSVSVSSTSHNPATFNITGMNIDVTFKYPYYVNWNENSENASVKIVKDSSLNRYVATIQLTNLNTTVFDLNNASQLYTLSADKTTITGFNSTTLSSLNNNLTLYFPANVTSIAIDAFKDNTNNPNKDIKILDMSTAVNLNSLGRGAFNSANRIQNIIIPPSVQEFNGWTFQNLHDRITIFIQGSYPNSNAKFNNTFSGATNLNIYVIDQVTKDSIFGAGGNSALTYDKVKINPQISDTNYIINNISTLASSTSSN